MSTDLKKDRESMLSALTKNIPPELIVTAPEKPDDVVSSEKMQEIIKDTEDDYAYSRANVKKLLATSDEAIAALANLASDSEHPRAFEVLSGLIKTASDVNKQLMDLQKDRKKLIFGEKESKGVSTISTTNNAIFVGTTTDLQDIIANNAINVTDV